MMDKNEYELLYLDALGELRRRGVDVGEPYFSRDGVRAVRIKNLPCTDELAFTEAWGADLARDIVHGPDQRPVSPEKLAIATDWLRSIARRAAPGFIDFKVE